MVLGSLAAAAHGIAIPCMIIVFGQMLNSFVDTGIVCDECKSPFFVNLTDTYNNLPGTKDFECDLIFSQDKKDQEVTK